jgi:hypothetical protein
MSQSVEIMSQNRVHMSMPGPILFLERGVAYGSDLPLLQLTEFVQISACLSRSRFLRLALPSGAPFVSSGHFERPSRENPVEASNRFSG